MYKSSREIIMKEMSKKEKKNFCQRNDLLPLSWLRAALTSTRKKENAARNSNQGVQGLLDKIHSTSSGGVTALENIGQL